MTHHTECCATGCQNGAYCVRRMAQAVTREVRPIVHQRPPKWSRRIARRLARVDWSGVYIIGGLLALFVGSYVYGSWLIEMVRRAG